MQYFSTNKYSSEVSFREALFTGLAPDGGLYMPLDYPKFKMDSFSEDLSYPELANCLILPFIGDDIPSTTLSKICEKAFSFSVPIVKLNDNFQILELFHGPTFAFKDFAARFMAQTMSYYMEQETVKLTILVAFE